MSAAATNLVAADKVADFMTFDPFVRYGQLFGIFSKSPDPHIAGAIHFSPIQLDFNGTCRGSSQGAMRGVVGMVSAGGTTSRRSAWIRELIPQRETLDSGFVPYCDDGASGCDGAPNARDARGEEGSRGAQEGQSNREPTMATLAEHELPLRDRLEAMAERAERASDTVATSETPTTVPWPAKRAVVERPTVADEPVEHSRKLELLGRMAAGAAHDLNNLLAVIGGHAELMALAAGPRENAHADVIQSSIRLASQLTGRLLAFSKPASTFEAPALDTVLAEAEPLVRAVAGSDVECIVLAEGEGARVSVRRDRIEQVILNLVANARDALTDSGVIAVQSSTIAVGRGRRGWPADRPSGRYAVLTVADNGRGMDAATRARIFEPYFTTRGASGTGLGLATVREIVDLARGHIEVETAPGQGALFRVFLPADDADAGFDRAVGELIAAANGRTALVVDDDAGVRRLAKAWLEAAGYDVIEARDGDEAARLARVVREPIDVLVADYVMPGLGGRKLAERLRFLRPALPVVFISGYGDCYAGADDRTRFVAKPFARGELLAAIEAVAPAIV